MARFIWLLVIVLVVYVFGSEAWKTFQQAQKPQYTAHPEL
jgi:ABC-type phosphate transport system permease subunit